MSDAGSLALSVLLFVLLALGLWAVVVYNGLVRLRNDIDKAWSNIDVLLRQRSDEVPNLVRAVQGYMAHEQRVLLGVTEARAAMVAAGNVGAKAAASDQLAGALKTLFAVAEGYPDLKASANFLALQRRLTGLESEIADRREFYNDAVTQYNTRIASFPDLLLARPLGFRDPLLLFRAGEADRVAPATRFDAA